MIKRLLAKIREDRALGHERELVPARGLERRLDRLQRAFDTELSSGASLNVRGTALAVGSALAILLVAQFSAVWLDDNNWDFPGRWDTLQEAFLYLSIFSLIACLVLAVIVIWPGRHTSTEMEDRIRFLNEGKAREEAKILLRMLEGQRARNERKAHWLRWAAIPLALAVATVVAQATVFALKASPIDLGACISHDGDADKPANAGLPPVADQETLAAQYAPRVYVHPREPWGPLRPDDFIGASRLVWNSSRGDDEIAARGSIESERLGAECESADDGCYEHNGCNADQVTRPTESPAIRAPGLHERRGFAIDPDRTVKRPSPPGNPKIPVYYEFRGGAADAIRITYWFFYGYSQPNLPGDPRLQIASHEGDWESIDVKLAATDGAFTATKVLYYAHGRNPRILDWSEVTAVREDGTELANPPPAPAHPVVFSAVYDHASYPAEGRYPECGSPCVDEAKRGPVIWDTWLRDVRRVIDEPWYGFGGAWGAGGGLKGEIGPLGPSPWKQSSDPDPDSSVLTPNAPAVQPGT
jgi:hypothetical protein